MTRPVRIFIAGPMTGLPDYNLPAFAAAADQLRAAGYEAVNPGHRGVIEGYTWSDYLRDSLRELLTCDAVAVLDGWYDSRGARLENHVADQLGMRIKYVDVWLKEAA